MAALRRQLYVFACRRRHGSDGPKLFRAVMADDEVPDPVHCVYCGNPLDAFPRIYELDARAAARERGVEGWEHVEEIEVRRSYRKDGQDLFTATVRAADTGVELWLERWEIDDAGRELYMGRLDRDAPAVL